MNIFKSIEDVFVAVEESSKAVKDLSFEEFQMFLGMLIDQYEADHDMSIIETNEMLGWLISMRSAIYEQIGPAPKRSDYE